MEAQELVFHSTTRETVRAAPFMQGLGLSLRGPINQACCATLPSHMHSNLLHRIAHPSSHPTSVSCFLVSRPVSGIQHPVLVLVFRLAGQCPVSGFRFLFLFSS